MNAIPPAPASDPARTAEQLAMLRELAEIGMALARAIGQQALAALEAPPPPDAAAPPAGAAGRPPPNRTDPGLAFARIARDVRQSIALEVRIAAGPPPAPRGRRAPGPPPDPKRDRIRRLVRQAADADGLPPDAFRREIEERLEDELEFDPDASADDVVAAVCDDLGLGRNVAQLPDEVLAIFARGLPSEAGRPEAIPSDATPSEPAATVGPDPAPGLAPPTPHSRPAGPDPP